MLKLANILLKTLALYDAITFTILIKVSTQFFSNFSIPKLFQQTSHWHPPSQLNCHTTRFELELYKFIITTYTCVDYVNYSKC